MRFYISFTTTPGRGGKRDIGNVFRSTLQPIVCTLEQTMHTPADWTVRFDALVDRVKIASRTATDVEENSRNRRNIEFA